MILKIYMIKEIDKIFSFQCVFSEEVLMKTRMPTGIIL